MYAFLKKTMLRIVPRSWLLGQEVRLRCVVAWFYRGNRFACNVCNSRLARFILLENGEQLCPQCGSLPRNRRLWQILTEPGVLRGTVLDFSPSRCLYRKLITYPGITYFSTDFAHEFIADYQYDITDIPQPAATFDLICCFHVLEHIENDRQAMRELWRVLKPGGVCLLQTPFREGNTYENAVVQTPGERLHHFGQEDHVRIYSVTGLQERLESVGFQVAVHVFAESADSYFGRKKGEIVVFAYKI